MFPFSDPVVPDPDTAQSLLLEELSRPEYDTEKDPVTRFFIWLYELIFGIKVEGHTDPPFEYILSIGFAVLLIVLVVYVVLNPIRLSTRTSSAVVGDEPVTLTEAEEHKARAAAAAQWDEAVVWAFRCLALVLDVQRIIRLTPGLTAKEVADQSAPHFTERTGDFPVAARTFDKVRYGDSAVSADDYAFIASLLDYVRRKGES